MKKGELSRLDENTTTGLISFGEIGKGAGLPEKPLMDHGIVPNCIRLSIHNGTPDYHRFECMLSTYLRGMDHDGQTKGFDSRLKFMKESGFISRDSDINAIAKAIDTVEELRQLWKFFQMNSRYVFDIFMKMISLNKVTLADRHFIEDVVEEYCLGACVLDEGAIVAIPGKTSEEVRALLEPIFTA